jgi:deoxyguanosine kinase
MTIAVLLGRSRPVVADWALLKQPVFAATTLAAADAARMSATVEVWADGVPAPDVLIGLSASVPVLMARVRQRNRPMEARLTSRDLAGLSAALHARSISGT